MQTVKPTETLQPAKNCRDCFRTCTCLWI